MKNSECKSDRKVLMHAHIFKNAGSTIDWILKKNFGRDFRDDREDSLMLKDSTYLQRLVDGEVALKAISSHSLPLPIQDMPGVDVSTLLMLRDPLLRIRSVYSFERKQKAKTPGAIHAKLYNFKDYVQWRMDPEISPTIRNMQVRYLTRRLPLSGQELDETHLLAAINFVKANYLVGIVERFDKSMAVFRRSLLNTGLDIDFSYKKQNITSIESLSKEQLIDQLKDDLGQSLFEEVLEQNKYDIALYNEAVEIVSTRFSKLSDFDKEIANSLRI